MKRILLTISASLCLHIITFAQELPKGGITEDTPSKSEYFSWINNTLEGTTHRQTAINLRFFDWLHRTYGMTLDIYAFDAGALDTSGRYGSTKSAQFKSQFPEGFGPLASQAAEMGTRFGIWAGPDGFGNTPEEAQERIDMMVGLVRDYRFALFKIDAVCGQLRPEKYEYFDKMMTEVRRYCPDFVAPTIFLDLGPCMKHITTSMMDEKETYIDVHMINDMTAPHHRGAALARKSPKGFTRLVEDHGVCISSCLDAWDDDLVLQAFCRNTILAPEIYGNPWLLRDDEYPTLAFIFNLHRDYRDILTHATPLPEDKYGPEAVSRGNGKTQFLALRNLTWEPATYRIRLNEETGLKPTDGKVKARLYHPYVLDLGYHAYGEEIEVEVLPFRAALVKLTSEPEKDNVALSGIPYQIVNDRIGTTGEVRLLGMPETSYRAKWEKGGEGTFSVKFKGRKQKLPWHRRLAVMETTDIPADAEALYYTTVFAADNNALEVRSLKRSGPTEIPEVEAARNAFFEQESLRQRDLWDQYLFDDDLQTGFTISQRWREWRVSRLTDQSCFCVNLGETLRMDSLIICVPNASEMMSQPLGSEISISVSADLNNWVQAQGHAGERMSFDLRNAGSLRYIILHPSPTRVAEVIGYKDGKPVERSKWTASNLFQQYGFQEYNATKAWKSTFRLGEIADGSYLCVAINGQHGREGAWAAFKVDGKYVGCPDRAPSFIINPFEFPVAHMDRNYTYYLPLTPDMKGKEIEAYVLKMGNFDSSDLHPEVWITTRTPFKTKTITSKLQ